jgi:hypothetical protein
MFVTALTGLALLAAGVAGEDSCVACNTDACKPLCTARTDNLLTGISTITLTRCAWLPGPGKRANAALKVALLCVLRSGPQAHAPQLHLRA